MTARTCCGRGAEVAGWVLPAAALALLPKCPMCVAAYVATATGLGVTFSTAAYIRTTVLVVSAGLLMFVIAKRGVRWARGRNWFGARGLRRSNRCRA